LARRRHRSWDQPPAAEKLVADETALLQLLSRWRAEATKAGHAIDRIALPTKRAGTVSRWAGGRGTERLWRGLEYEEVHLHAYARPVEAKAGMAAGRLL